MQTEKDKTLPLINADQDRLPKLPELPKIAEIKRREPFTAD
jgi:hypothetical protein